MNQRRALAAVVLGVALCFSPVSFGSWAHWTEWGEGPAYIVVGTMEDVTFSACEFACGSCQEAPHPYLVVFDTGWIRVEDVLLGDENVQRIPVTWIARTRLDPPVDDLFVSHGHMRDFKVGDRYIWFVAQLFEEEIAELSAFHRIYTRGMADLSATSLEIEEYREKQGTAFEP